MVTAESLIIENLSNYYLKILRNKVVYKIFRIPKNAMQTGDDTPLKNLWDEICVQVQGEYFTMWDLYEDLIRGFCSDVLENESNDILSLLYYKACKDAWIDFDYDAFDKDLVINMLYDFIITYAADYHNKSIENFIENGYEVDC